uniref:Col_cuticle_N domain-containing protein n=1 Tax=Elaeophora elaphi TaxID=1147741 RepID=A0A0R3RII4_9BILA
MLIIPTKSLNQFWRNFFLFFVLQSLSCWNRTANFFSKTLMSVFLRHVTTQRSIDRMMEYVRSSNNTSDFLTTELINKTVMAFVSASFKTISAKKQPALLSCPRGCEKPSEFWLLWSSISMMISGILTVVIIIKTLAMDRSDQKYASVEETVENDKRKAN